MSRHGIFLFVAVIVIVVAYIGLIVIGVTGGVQAWAWN